jgi:hypothetical protein
LLRLRLLIDSLRSPRELAIVELLGELMKAQKKLPDGDSDRDFVLWQLHEATNGGAKPAASSRKASAARKPAAKRPADDKRPPAQQPVAKRPKKADNRRPPSKAQERFEWFNKYFHDQVWEKTGPHDPQHVRRLLNLFRKTKTDEDVVDIMWLLQMSYRRGTGDQRFPFLVAVERRDAGGVTILKAATKARAQWAENVTKDLSKAEKRMRSNERLRRLANITSGRLLRTRARGS